MSTLSQFIGGSGVVLGAFENTIIARNGQPIMSLAENMTVDRPGVLVTLTYINSTIGWSIT